MQLSSKPGPSPNPSPKKSPSPSPKKSPSPSPSPSPVAGTPLDPSSAMAYQAAVMAVYLMNQGGGSYAAYGTAPFLLVKVNSASSQVWYTGITIIFNMMLMSGI